MSVPQESQEQKQIWTSVERTKACFEIHICIPIRYSYYCSWKLCMASIIFTVSGLHYESPYLIHTAQMFYL